MASINELVRFLDHVDMRTLNSVAEKLKQSRNKKEQAVGAFLSRVHAYRTSEPGPTSVETRSDPGVSRLFDGLSDIR